MPATQPDYAAPAVDKALDILEALADAPSGLTQLEIAKAISRSPGQIFRMLSRLEKRGYVSRNPDSGQYNLSMRLFDLVHRHEPIRTLISTAIPLMQALSSAVLQSCNLGVLEGDRVRVIAQMESPADFGFRVRVGATFSAPDTATGKVLLAFAANESAAISSRERGSIRDAGFLIEPDNSQPGITDVVYPIFDTALDHAVAALTVPYVSTGFSNVPAPDVSATAAQTAQAIQYALGSRSASAPVSTP